MIPEKKLAHAQLFLDLKSRRPKSEDWISIAKKCKDAADDYKSTRTAAETFGVSYHLLRSIISLLDLPAEVQQSIKEGKIGYDTAQRINTIRKDGEKRQIEVSRIIEDLPQHVQRDVINYAKRVPNGDLKEYVSRLMAPEKRERIHVGIVPLTEEEFAVLDKVRKKKSLTLEKLLVEIVREWIQSGKAK